MPTLTLVEPLNPPKPSPRRIEIVFEFALATAKSCLPSPLKSPIATELGELTLTSVEPLNPPKPSPRRIETVPDSLATAKSCLPSPLKSPIATELGPVPKCTSAAFVKPGVKFAPQGVLVTVNVKVFIVVPPGPNAIAVTV